MISIGGFRILEYRGTRGDEGGLSVTYVLKDLRVRFESLEGDTEAARSAAEDEGRQSVSLKKRF